jgi:hypothetical protein
MISHPSATATRGRLLSALILLYAVAFLAATAVLLGAQDQAQRLLGHFPPWFSPVVLALDVVRLVALAGLWRGQRWAVPPLFLAMATEGVVGILFMRSVWTFPVRLVGVSAGLVVVGGLFAYAIGRRWAYFRRAAPLVAASPRWRA